MRNLKDNIKTSFKKLINEIGDKKILFNPNFLIDILIKFILISSFLFILYKFFLIKITTNYIVTQANTHIEFYIEQIKEFLGKFISINDIITEITNNINSISPSNVDTSTNDTNFTIIYTTVVSISVLVVLAIIIITNSFKQINVTYILFSLIFNLIILVVSQLIFFYLVYSFIDPIKLYKILYYNFVIKKDLTVPSQNIITPTITNSIITDSKQQQISEKIPILSIITDSKQQQISEKIPNKITSLIPPTTTTKNTIPNTVNVSNTIAVNKQSIPYEAPRDTILPSKKIATLYVFMLIFLILFIITITLFIINIISITTHNTFPMVVLPLNNISILIYGVLSAIFLFLFIIMLLLFLNKI